MQEQVRLFGKKKAKLPEYKIGTVEVLVIPVVKALTQKDFEQAEGRTHRMGVKPPDVVVVDGAQFLGELDDKFREVKT